MDKSLAKQYRERMKREGNCIRCGQFNLRAPKVYCEQCAIKASFMNEDYAKRRRKMYGVRITELEKRVKELENKFNCLINGLKS